MSEGPGYRHPVGAELNGKVESLTDMKAIIDLNPDGAGEIRPPYLDTFSSQPGEEIAVIVTGFHTATNRYAVRPKGDIPIETRVELMREHTDSVTSMIGDGASLSRIIDTVSKDVPFSLNIRFLRILLSGAASIDAWDIGTLTMGFDSNQALSHSVIDELEKRWSNLIGDQTTR
ncbi:MULTISPECIES: hypothetical protein [Nocardia]|uniref:hypothetical protein n=1 Tax=Nocardia TaxID=1817 RepID=UPI001C4F4793|nr:MULTISPECIES: hypothetical protein [Nocardia]